MHEYQVEVVGVAKGDFSSFPKLDSAQESAVYEIFVFKEALGRFRSFIDLSVNPKM